MHDLTARRNPEVQRRRRRNFATLIALCLFAAGCSGDPFGRSNSGATSSSSSFGDRFSSLFRSQPAAQDKDKSSAETAPPPVPQDFECPSMAVRQGASTFAVSAPGAESAALGLRYQATFGQLARECQLIGTTLKMRVGVEGRIIVGPAGAVGPVELPLRLAVVKEGPEPKVIMTKLIWVSVVIPPEETNVSFSQIDDDLSFPMPQQKDELEAYVVYVGFDAAAVKPERKPAAKKPAPKPRR
jgi:hypothetical protein